MTHEIWLADHQKRLIAYAGDKRALEAGKMNSRNVEATSKIIAEGEGSKLDVIDGHQAQHLIVTEKYQEVKQSTNTVMPPHSPVKPIEDRKFKA